MEKEKMTIHRGLAELKTIDKRIEKKINSFTPIGASKNGQMLNVPKSEDAFKKDAMSDYQSILDLINRKQKIKSAIILANSSTIVTISGKNMTISEAINYKEIIDLKKQLLQQIHKSHSSVVSNYNRMNEDVEKTALKNAQILLDKDVNELSPDIDQEMKKIIDTFTENHKPNLVDPLTCTSIMEVLDSESDKFFTEIDYVLSEINALTFIEV